MKYFLMICHDDAFRPSERLVADIGAWIRDMTGRKVHVSGYPLRPPRDAATVRVRAGRVRVKAGPFSRSGEKMCACHIVECPSREAAIAVAASHPMAKVATIEVRPVWEELADS